MRGAGAEPGLAGRRWGPGWRGGGAGRGAASGPTRQQDVRRRGGRGAPTLQRLTSQSSGGAKRHMVRKQSWKDRGSSRACVPLLAGPPAAGKTSHPSTSLKESEVPQPIFQSAKNFQGVCMLKGPPPPSHSTKREMAESGMIKGKQQSQGSGLPGSYSCDEASARDTANGNVFGVRHFRPFPPQAARLQPDPSYPQA